MPHHMDFWMDGFKPDETIIRYDLYRYKADTNSDTYAPKYPQVQGFTGKRANERPDYFDSDGIDEKNDERADVTPFPAKTYTDMYGERPVGMMKFIKAFLNNGDEWGDPDGWDGFDKNGYLKFEYKRNKYPLRFNYDPSKIKGDNEFNSTNQLDTFYEFPLKCLSPDVDTDEEYKKVAKGENPSNLLDNPENLQKLSLTDLVFNDKNDNNKLKVKRPDNLSDQMVFKGWALDPAGSKLIWENPGEKMPSHPVNLYAKWGEPDYKWKVTFDPDGGVLENINEEKLTQERKTIQEGDIGQIEVNTYAKKEANDGDKQVFTVIQRQKLVEPKKPTKRGYEFMGWEVIHYTKDANGNYTSVQDTSYRDTYKVPELYSFGNDVVSPVYLKAIWVKSDVVDIESYHHFLDKDYKENTAADRETQILRDRRVGSYLAAVGSRQNAERILVPKDEWDDLEKNNTTKLKDSMTYAQYMKLDKENPRVNSYSQQIRIGAEKVQDPNKNPVTEPSLIDNPLNVFHFYYRPFRHREYKVNYLDERGRKEVEKFIEDSKKAFAGIKNNPNLTDAQKDKEYKDLLEANRTDFEAIRKKYAIIDQEAVKNGKRHFDARNYRPIAGWVLNDKPQQQLFFDINEDTNAFYGINETGFDEINFFYKDVRVVETKKDDPVPKGYVRVTFKAADGGSFTDKDGKAVKELYYDVVKGLRSQLLPVPKLLGEGETKVNGKYYITPDNGKNFTKWDKDELLNDNTILEQNYEFTAYFDWSDLKVSSKELVSTESYIDPDDKWTNEFAPTIDELKNQLVLTKNNQVINNIDEHIVAQLFDEKGKELKTDEDVLKLLSEQNKSDTEELVRRVNIKAKVKFKDQKYKALENKKEGLGDQLEKLKKEDPVDQTKINELEQKIKDTTDAIKAHEAGLTEQELDIPVTIYKNVYEALTKTEKPLFLSEAEKGDLKDITGDYVKVTVQPTNKPTNKDAKIYYVNPYAWVKISEVDISQDASSLGFTKWTADKDKQNENNEENGVFDFDKRHMFTEDTVIKPDFSEDVKEQKDGEPKPDVPNDFVKVIVDKTANAELGVDEKQTQTFWVNPTKVVTIPVNKPTGKTEAAAAGEQAKAWIFEKWISDEAPARTWNDTITAQFREPETTITANYKQADNIIPYDPEEPKERPKDYVRVKFDADEGLTLSNVKYYYVKQNSGVKLSDLEKDKINYGYPKVDAKTGYKFTEWKPADKEIGVDDITVTAKAEKLKPAIPDNGTNTKPDGYVEVEYVIKTEDQGKGSLKGVLKYFVKPNEYVPLNPPDTKPNTGYEFGAWDEDTTIPTIYTKDTKITGSFNDLNDVIKKVDNQTKKPDGYKTVTFVIDPTTGGKIKDGEITVYYVNPAKDVTVPQPKTSADTGYKFEKWDKDTTTAKKYADNTTVKGNFKKLDDIIPSKDGANAQPEGYVTVTFRADDNGKLVGDKKEIVYYVNPKAGIKIVDTTNNPNKEIAIPNVIADKNYELDKWYESIDKDNSITTDLEYVARFNKGKVTLTYDAGEGTGTPPITVIVDNGTKVRLASATGLSKADASFKGWSIDESTDLKQDGDEITLTKDTKAVAQWTKDEEIIKYDPKEPITKPDGYVRVTFEADNGLGLIEQKAYYVKANKGITLKAIKDDTTNYGYPSYKEETGYKFKEWNLPDSTRIEASDIVVKAKATKLDTVIPENKDDGSTNDKPKGYKEVSFVIKTGDEKKGSLEGNTKFYVNPTEYVTINPPTTEANTGFEFGAWDKDSTRYTVYDKDTTITGSFNGLKDIIPKTNPDGTENKQPTSYVTVTFVIDPATGGQIGNGETTVYYVKPNTDVTVPQPRTQADIGYEFKEWDQDTTTAKKYAADITVKGSFKKLDDIIPSTDENGKPNAKPAGYITVTFDKGDNGKEITGQTVYYVNPNADKTIADLTKPKVTPETGWKQKTGADAWDKEDTQPITGDLTVTAKYKELDDVIPKTTNDESEKPSGYITVTFDKGEHGKELTGQAVYYVNPNKAVVLKDKEPTAVPNTGYDFARWDTTIERAIQYKANDVIKALYNQIGSIIPKENDQTKKPEGYVTVTFDKGTNGKKITGTTVYYVDPNREVNLPAPTVIPNVGWKQKTGDDAWDSALTQTFTGDKTIKAQYDPLDDIIPQKNTEGLDRPDGYVKVTFIGEHGTLEKPTVYYVKPNTEIWLRDSIFNKMIDNGNPDIGYTSQGNTLYEGKTEVPNTRITITEDKNYTYKFAPLADVIEKIKDDQKPPKGYVKVTLDPTDKATDKTKTVYFVNSTKEVTLTEVKKPTGKEITDKNGNKYTYELDTWTSIRGVLGSWPLSNGPIKAKFTQDTDIEARYTKTEDLAPIAKENVITPVGVKPDAKDLIKNVYDENDQTNKGNLPKGTTFEYAEKPNVSEAGDITAKVKVIYPNGNKVIVEVPIKVVDNVIPQEGEEKPNNVPKDFVKVTFVPTDKGTMEGAKIFWVKPNENVKIPVKDPVGVGYNIFKEWKLGVNADGAVFKANKDTIFTEEETIITATYIDSDNIIPFDPKAENPKQRPDGYIRVTFDADLGLKLTESKAYYVKKNAGITIKQLTKPKYQEASGYKFDKWDKDDMFEIKEDIVVTALAKFTPSEPGYPEVIYRDKIVEKEKIVEKIVKVGENDELLKEIRYMQGYNGKFRPYDGLTRAEAAQILANALKADGYRYDANYALSYTDVGSKWYTDAVRVVTQANVFQGYSDGTFRPQSKITRAEWVATLRRFQDLKKANGNAMMLKNGHWATAEVEAAYEAGWLGVYQNGIAKFDADKPITRQEVAYVSNRAFRRVLDKVYLKRSVNTLLTYKDINPSMPLYEDILCASNTLLTDNRYYKANTVVLDNLTFNIVTDYLRIQQKKFQYNVIR